MKFYTLPVGAARLAGLVMLMLIATSVLARADDPPDSTDVIQAFLPDSLSLNDKVVYVDFWASWCVPCRHSLPLIQTWYDKYHERGLEVVAVNVDKDHAAALKFLENNQVSYPIVFDSTGALAKLYGLEVMPTSFVYGRDGRLESEKYGFRLEEADSLTAAIVRLLSEGKSH